MIGLLSIWYTLLTTDSIGLFQTCPNHLRRCSTIFYTIVWMHVSSYDEVPQCFLQLSECTIVREQTLVLVMSEYNGQVDLFLLQNINFRALDIPLVLSSSSYSPYSFCFLVVIFFPLISVSWVPLSREGSLVNKSFFICKICIIYIKILLLITGLKFVGNQ